MAVTTAEKIEIMQAHERGETIEFQFQGRTDDKWFEVREDYTLWDWKNSKFRIKPEPEYRPFANAEEFKPHRDKWIICDRDHHFNNESYRVVIVCKKGIVFGAEEPTISFAELLNRFTFEDGTPCGVKL